MNDDLLSKRETDILKELVFSGSTKKEIAAKLCIEQTTVGTHLANIYQKKFLSGKGSNIRLIVDFWKGAALKTMNCDKCRFNKDKVCACLQSYFYGDQVNSGMICNKFEEEKTEDKK